MKSILVAILATILALHQSAFAVEKQISSGDLGCLALTAWNEARGQSDTEIVMVLNVIKNRTQHEEYGDTMCKVVLEKGQFSMGGNVRNALNAMKRGVSVKFRFASLKESNAYEKISALATLVRDGKAKDITYGATHFYSPRLRAQLGLPAHPNWARKLPLTAVVSGFRFHRLT